MMASRAGFGLGVMLAALGLFAACGGDAVSFGPGAGGAGAGTSQGGSAEGGNAQGGNAEGGGPGTCDCDAAYMPVCGTDGMTYDAACGEVCVPTTIACQGECPCMDCGQLEQAYAAALVDAKMCDPSIDVPQCTERIADALACPCPTSIDPANGEAAATLKSLQDQWDALQCGALIDCPAVECAEIKSAECSTSGSGNSGSCVETTDAG